MDISYASSFCVKTEEIMEKLLDIMGTSPGLSSTTHWHSKALPELEVKIGHSTISGDNTMQSRSISPASSIYSDISAQSSASIAEDLDPSYRAYPPDLDMGNISSYSYPSSRTISTDYGLFYTRMAISMESIENDSSNQE